MLLSCTGCSRKVPIHDAEVGPEVLCPKCGAELVPWRWPWRPPAWPLRCVTLVALTLFGTWGLWLTRGTSRLVPSPPPSPLAAARVAEGLLCESERKAIACLSSEGAAAVPRLIAAMEGPHVELRAEAARALGQIGPDAVPALPQLTAALRGPDADLRRAAIEALEQIGPDAGPAMLEVLRLVRLGSVSARPRAAAALVAVAPGAPVEQLPRLVAVLDDPDETVRAAVRAALASAGGAAAPLLADAAMEGPLVRRLEAIRALKEMGLPATVVARRLREALDALEAMGGSDTGIAVALIDCLAEIAPTDEMFFGWWLEKTKGYAAKRAAAFRALVRYPRGTPGLSEALMQALRDRDPKVRAAVYRALPRRLEDRDRVIENLVGALLDGAFDDCTPICEALVEIGAGSVPALVRVLEGKEEEHVLDAARGNSELARLLEDRHAADATRAAIALGDLGPRAAGATEALTRCLESPKAPLRAAAAHALGWIGEAARGALPALRERVLDPNPMVSKIAEEAVHALEQGR